MKVLDLGCPDGHAFEGWFASEQDFQDQLNRRLLECPVCGQGEIRKRLSAPRLNLGSRAAAVSGETSAGGEASAGGNLPSAAELPVELQAAWLSALRQVVAHTEDVGSRFADQALRMHRGEVPAKAIRGQATPQEARELWEEGVPVLPLPDIPAVKGTLQ